MAKKEKPTSDDLIALLSEVSQCFTREDDLPDELLPRIDAAIEAYEAAAGVESARATPAIPWCGPVNKDGSPAPIQSMTVDLTTGKHTYDDGTRGVPVRPHDRPLCADCTTEHACKNRLDVPRPCGVPVTPKGLTE